MILLTAVVVSVVMSVPARAGFDATLMPEVRQSLAVAEAYFKTQAPCRPAVDAVDAQLERGRAWIEECRMTLRTDDIALPALTRYGWGFVWSGVCATVVHEYGHLLGYRDDEPGVPVMGHALPVVPTLCIEAFLPPPCWVRTPRERRFYQHARPDLALRLSRRRARRPIAGCRRPSLSEI